MENAAESTRVRAAYHYSKEGAINRRQHAPPRTRSSLPQLPYSARQTR